MNKEQVGGNVIIVGAGPAGLTSAFFYAQKGFSVTVIEKSDAIGGLSKGISFLGNKYDLGPHSFYSNYSAETKQFFERFIGKENYDKVKPSKLIQTKGVLFHSPLRLTDTLKVRNLFFFTAYAFYKVKAQFSSAKNKNLIDKHGSWTREKIFVPYCQKYFNLHANLVSDNFIELLYANRTDKDDNSIYIPRAGYMGKLWENLYGYLCEIGVNFEFNQTITNLKSENNKITEIQTENMFFDHLDCIVSTIPLLQLHKLMFPSLSNNISLNYRATIVVFIEIEKLNTRALYLTNYNTNTIIGRISFCSNWKKDYSNPVISAEIWCDEKDEIFNQSDAEITAMVIDSFHDISVVDIGENPKSKVIKIPKCFPVLEKGYETHLENITQELNSFSNLNLAGRHGRFQWDGIDDIIYAAHHE